LSKAVFFVGALNTLEHQMDLDPRELLGDELNVIVVDTPASMVHKDGHVTQI
jgi:hypothetical protein